ncbi:diguanylate cyclase domain-containing protein [Rhabdochromatium marinum]|uniref:diguanylate cyclase domain-containing protein n=1 Tax=Rhabdochromatium marinum TaxID=48729 RepID=UPI0019078489|nr:diguanylate cyclase [Rhabdochromatium marinum]MBK1648709.1 diguanylate cyclase response regulator [Rhabdochromatium marinum]
MNTSHNRHKILIVDDTKENIELLMELFRGDYRVSAATTPERALKLAHSDPQPDLILLDILMPEMDGYQVCAALKNDEATKRIPIIFVTAVSEVMDAAKGFASGAVDYITKPFHPPMVKARVALHLDLKNKYNLLETYAFLDALTEIPNRRHFEQTLDEEWRRAQRTGQPLSLLLFDVDHFKRYNDNYGHGKGDECLRQVAQAAASVLRRSGDFIARYGGEEFMVILPHADTEQSTAIAQDISAAVDALGLAHEHSPVEWHVTISTGLVTVHPQPPNDSRFTIAQLIDCADEALYNAKHAGRHRIERSILESETKAATKAPTESAAQP